MAEMEASIRAQNLLQPILLRPHPVHDGKFEIVAGERRFRAFKAVFGDDANIPSLTRVLTDAEARTAALTENVIRANMTPVEEAQAAAKILGETQGNREEAAKILGWKLAMLDSRLALMHATDAVRQALQDKKILLGHAELLAVCRKEAQETALAQLLKQEKLMPVSDLKAFLEKSSLLLNLAIFDKSECATCHHNSDQQSALFAESISGGRCTNKSCFEGKTEGELNKRVSVLKDEYQVVRLVRPGENFTIKPLLANGDKGVGDEQALACQTCKNFGAVVSGVPDSLGKVYKQMCMDVACNDKMVKARIDATKQKEQPAPDAGAKKAGEGTQSGSKPAAKPAPEKTKPVGTEPTGRIVEYREKLWRMIFCQVVGKMNVVDNRTVLMAIVLSRPGVLDSHALQEAMDPELPFCKNSHSMKESLAGLRKCTQEQLGAALQKVAAHVSSGQSGIEIKDVVAVLASYEVDIAKHWKVSKPFFDLLTKNEIEAVCTELGIKQAMGAEYAKARNGGKDDFIKAILGLTSFEYRGKVPKLMNW
jgi:ParB family chromosome partitioning protein